MLDNKRSRIVALDGLRTIAVGCVFYTHFIAWMVPGTKELAGVGVDGGIIGVHLFFVLSGYLITHLLTTKYDVELGASVSLRAFWANRLLRLVPLVIVAMLFCAALSPAPLGLHFYLYNLTFATNFSVALFNDWLIPAGHFWSLALEMQFYLIYPFFVWLFRHNLLIAIIGAMVSLVLVQSVISSLEVFASPGFLLPYRADAFLWGGIIYLFHKQSVFPNLIKILLTVGGTLFFGMAIVRLAFGGPGIIPSLVAANIFCAGVVGWALMPQTRFSRALSNPILVHLGRISYGIYVWHLLVGLLLPFLYSSDIALLRPLAAIAASVPQWVTILALTVGMSELSWYLFERRFIRLGHRLSDTILAKTSRPRLHPATAYSYDAPSKLNPRVLI